MRLIKLTDADGYARRGSVGKTLWLPYGVTPPKLDGGRLCEAGVYHCYESSELAVLMDPIHAQLLPVGGVAHRAEGEPVVQDHVQVGCHELTCLEPATLPKLTTAQLVRVVIYCAQAASDDEYSGVWNGWAERWLSGKDRSHERALMEVFGAWRWNLRPCVGAAVRSRAATTAAAAARTGTPCTTTTKAVAAEAAFAVASRKTVRPACHRQYR